MLCALLLAGTIQAETPGLHGRTSSSAPRQLLKESQSESASALQPRPDETDPNGKRDWVTTGALMGAALAFDLWPNPQNCRWCDRTDSGGDSLNSFDRSTRSAWVWSSGNRATANRLSWATEFVPLIFLVPRGDRSFDETALPVFKTLAATYLVTDGVKVAAARERPLVHFSGVSANSFGRDANKSFFSSHVSGAFSMLFALARVYSDRGDSQERWVWIVGLPAAVSTGYLRVAADKHYATDILAGAAVGGAMGWFVPGLMKHRPGRHASLQPALEFGGRTLFLRWAW